MYCIDANLLKLLEMGMSTLFDYCLVDCASKNASHKGKCLKQIECHAQIISTILDSMINIIEEPYTVI